MNSTGSLLVFPAWIAGTDDVITFLLIVLMLLLLLAAAYVFSKARQVFEVNRRREIVPGDKLKRYIETMSSAQIDLFLKIKHGKKKKAVMTLIPLLFFLLPGRVLAQDADGSLLKEGGIIITLILISIPVIAGVILMIIKVRRLLRAFKDKQKLEVADRLAEYLDQADTTEIEEAMLKRRQALEYSLTHHELSGHLAAEDDRGLLQKISSDAALPVVAPKKKAMRRPGIDPALSKLILWFMGTATFWLIFGTTVGEYLGFKFVAPDIDRLSWLSFGRLRPVHTNAVFWGWASLGMIGLGYYVVPRVGNAPLKSIKLGWYSLYLINAAVIIGTIFLMAGINNGGGEYREYVWPVMLLFGIGLVLTLINYMQTVARRKTHEIYISNWYIIAAVIFALIISLVAYLPFWQDGLGETIIQGYYMHQGVGMWFMLFTLGIVYYFLPQQLNKPIYSYSLGILAFWTQILFYTLIGTHHFVFSSIPWSLQTVAIVGSMGMVIPVAAGTANFILTFNGAWHKVTSSYTLPFFLTGIIFYFTGSLQGTAEAFRTTNLIWHFTDFTVAHSHLTMYGIISFFLWAAIYAIIPRLTGREAPQITVGTHFWLALIGLLFYTFPLMYGSTLKGMMWLEGKPFMEGVVFMAPYWLWRAIGGTLMWVSHLFFAYNLYKMLAGHTSVDVAEAAIEKLEKSATRVDNEV